MAIKKEITFESLTYKLTDVHRVAAYTALRGVASTDFDYSQIAKSAAAYSVGTTATGSVYISGSTSGADAAGFLCVYGLNEATG